MNIHSASISSAKRVPAARQLKANAEEIKFATGKSELGTVERKRSMVSRVAKYDWVKVLEELSSQGCAVIERLLSPDECRQVATLYPQEEHFRRHVHMARHGLGKGEYRYFKYPLPHC
jgi:hypothetical protein